VLTSANWLNDYLDPPASPAEQADLLTRVGFPLDAQEPLSGQDVRQDFELTSNRGDCLSIVGLAREIAAASGRRLRAPQPQPRPNATAPPAARSISVANMEKARCPLYTARVIRGARVGPSPAWIADRLRAVGQIPRNNIVDASNFVLFELGQPTHVFDLARLAGPRIIVRMAKPGEPFLPIGEGASQIKLAEEDLVIADAEKAVALAGVMGGAHSAVSAGTTDLLIEAAAFDPVCVRATSRRHGIESGSSYRFERGVHPGQVDAAAERLVELILQSAGGELCQGAVSDGEPIPAPRQVSMRTQRCRQILGVPVEDRQMVQWLTALELAPRHQGGVIQCTVPLRRMDLEREIDLIEEVGRMMGLDAVKVEETVRVRVPPLQPWQMARRAVNDALVGMGFIEAITHGLIDARDAAHFVAAGARLLEVESAGAGHTQAGSVLRPSLVPSLLRVLARNHDNGLRRMMVFESAATFQLGDSGHEERRKLAMLMDVEDAEAGLRSLRGAVDRIIEILAGPGSAVEVAGAEAGWLEPGAAISAAGRSVGWLGLLPKPLGRAFGLDGTIAAAELELGHLEDGYPPQTQAGALPVFPAVERDVSALVGEQVTWARIRGVVAALDLDHLEDVVFVCAFRGPQIGPGRKSVTLRLRFRAPDRTLVSESVDAQVNALVEALGRDVGAEIRR
jgi:phenylalanyl-tRNA synthetase beta chain